MVMILLLLFCCLPEIMSRMFFAGSEVKVLRYRVLPNGEQVTMAILQTLIRLKKQGGAILL